MEKTTHGNHGNHGRKKPCWSTFRAADHRGAQQVDALPRGQLFCGGLEEVHRSSAAREVGEMSWGWYSPKIRCRRCNGMIWWAEDVGSALDTTRPSLWAPLGPHLESVPKNLRHRSDQTSGQYMSIAQWTNESDTRIFQVHAGGHSQLRSIQIWTNATRTIQWVNNAPMDYMTSKNLQTGWSR